jgi:hypothetical protein
VESFCDQPRRRLCCPSTNRQLTYKCLVRKLSKNCDRPFVEAPAIFKRGAHYYALFGKCCAFCAHGTGIGVCVRVTPTVIFRLRWFCILVCLFACLLVCLFACLRVCLFACVSN